MSTTITPPTVPTPAPAAPAAPVSPNPLVAKPAAPSPASPPSALLPRKLAPLAPVPTPLKVEKPEKADKKRGKSTSEKLLSKLKATSSSSDAGASNYSMAGGGLHSNVKYFLMTGIPSLDAITGGFPVGRITEIFGSEGCAKTALSFQTVAAAAMVTPYVGTSELQFEMGIYEKLPDKTFKKVENCEITALYFDNEQSLIDGQRIQLMGKEVPAIVGEADTIDILFKDIDTAIDTLAEVEKETKITQFLVVVVDTVASTSTKEEMKQNWDKVDYSRAPAQLYAAFRVLTRKLRRQNVCLICTNQARRSFSPAVQVMRNPKAMYIPSADEFDSPGGKALPFFASLRIFMTRLPTDLKLKPGIPYPSGFVIQFTTVKNRQQPPRRSGRMALLFGPGISPQYSILEQILFLKLATVEKGAVIFSKSLVAEITGELKATGSLAQQDIGESEDDKADKLICPTKQDWPVFYQSNKAFVEALWARCRKIMTSTEILLETPDADAHDEEDGTGETTGDY